MKVFFWVFCRDPNKTANQVSTIVITEVFHNHIRKQPTYDSAHFLPEPKMDKEHIGAPSYYIVLKKRVFPIRVEGEVSTMTNTIVILLNHVEKKGAYTRTTIS